MLSPHPRLPSGNFYGQTVLKDEAGGFRLSETHYLPRSTLPLHSHESDYLCFVLKGSYRERYERSVRSCEPLMILYHPAGELHAQFFDRTGVDLFRIEIHRERLTYPGYSDLTTRSREFRSALSVGLARKLYREFRAPDSISHLAIEGLALELIAVLVRNSRDLESRQPPRWLSSAYELIDSGYLEPLTLDEIASQVGVHPVTLAREFRRYYHRTVGETVRRKRIDFACSQLRMSKGSVGDVAVAAGFYDQSHFARTFKKLIGVTPSEYLRFRRS